ncbi:MAG: hypothetical protein RLP02_35630, partial [Coleofasciculus sp. C2-GNP5-27]
GNRQQATGNRQQATGNWQQGNVLTYLRSAISCISIGCYSSLHERLGHSKMRQTLTSQSFPFCLLPSALCLLL